MAFYNIDSTAHGNTDVSIIITECTALGVSTPPENYSFAQYHDPIIYYAAGDAQVAPYFQIVSHEGRKSPILTKDNVIKVNGTAHGQAKTKDLADDILDLITTA
jgi:hypothetical protein